MRPVNRWAVAPAPMLGRSAASGWNSIMLAGSIRLRISPRLFNSPNLFTLSRLRSHSLIDSTGGLHGHVLFKELWVLDTAAERAQAALLLRRLQRTIQIAALAHGWKVDTTADLARVLRPTGTFNFKSGTPQLVTICEDTGIRYNPSDLADAPWLAEVVDTYTSPTSTGDFPEAHLDRMVPACAWLTHCRDDATTLSEPEWYAMLGIVGRCVDGEQHAHAWSAPYPRYDHTETAKKLQHALQDPGPRTCQYIRYQLGCESSCAGCVHWCQIKSPITLAMDDGVRLIKGPQSTPGPRLRLPPTLPTSPIRLNKR